MDDNDQINQAPMPGSQQPMQPDTSGQDYSQPSQPQEPQMPQEPSQLPPEEPSSILSPFDQQSEQQSTARESEEEISEGTQPSYSQPSSYGGEEAQTPLTEGGSTQIDDGQENQGGNVMGGGGLTP